jgi:hypothetical protein
MPKKVLHDLIANHKDTSAKFSNDSNARLQRSGYNCHADDLVVESPFIENDLPVQIPGSPSFSLHFIDRSNDFHSVSQFFFELRGPPFII